jgi:hypothetical protein
VARGVVLSAALYEELDLYLLSLQKSIEKRSDNFVNSSYISDFYSKEEILKIIRERFKSYGFKEKNIKEIISDYKLKYNLWIRHKKAFKNFVDNWVYEREVIMQLIKNSKKLLKVLDRSGIKFRLNKDYKFAFLNAHFIRRRFTIGDLASFVGFLDERVYRRVRRRVSSE